tara:strand:- start:3908 stop:4390 length:483 start_codon:yes stop_codon:yes gene_type:complete
MYLGAKYGDDLLFSGPLGQININIKNLKTELEIKQGEPKSRNNQNEIKTLIERISLLEVQAESIRRVNEKKKNLRRPIDSDDEELVIYDQDLDPGPEQEPKSKKKRNKKTSCCWGKPNAGMKNKQTKISKRKQTKKRKKKPTKRRKQTKRRKSIRRYKKM